MKILYIKWFDSAYHRNELYPDEIKDDECVVIETCGFFVKETKKMIALAADWTNDAMWRHLIYIPKVNILKKKFITPPTGR